MPWPKGKPRPPGAGRRKGTPNKRTHDLAEALEGLGYSIPKKIIELLDSEALAADLKVDFLHKLLPYLHSQRKPIDPSGYLTIEQASGMLGAQMAKFRAALIALGHDQEVVTRVLASTTPSPNGSRGESMGTSPSNSGA